MPSYENTVLEAHRQETEYHNLLHQKHWHATLTGNYEEYSCVPIHVCPCKWCVASRTKGERDAENNLHL